ncbi:AAA family ATPase [Aliarcobacter butzleri]|uniref:AAA family ATPase n=1 Tax=Aliarcobacter butzleri TaxID=28197 RepID=UPI003AF7D3CC
MELVYLWVEEYKNIKNQGFNFSPRFECKYDESLNELTIDENKEYVSIFPDNINITAIVGKNGVGKSNLTNFFSEIQNLTHSDNSYEDREKYIKIFKTLEYMIVFFDNPMIFIFRPYLSKIINKTKYRYIYDKTINYHTEFNFAFYNTSSFENYKYKEELASLYERIVEHDNYEYMIHTIMQSNEDDILKNIFKQETVSFKEFIINYRFTVDNLNTFFGWIYNYVENFQNTIFDKEKTYRYKVTKILNYFDENCTFPRNINEFTKEQKSIIIKIILSGGLDSFEFNTNEGYLNVLAILFKEDYLELVKNKKFFNYLINDTIFEMATNDDFEDDILLKLKIKEMRIWELYKQQIMTLISNDIVKNNLIIKINNYLVDISNLSSGEKSILLLKLIINKLINEYNKLKPENKSLVILLDEPETYLHPQLQKKLISDLVNTFSNIDFEIHFIITTHSSFLLSDLHKKNIVLLDKFDDETEKKYPKLKRDSLETGNCINVSEHIELKTFGANIHTLLSNGFFMSDGLMGQFAKSKINEIKDFYEKVKNSKNLKEEHKKEFEDNIKSFIHIQSIIGEPFLQTIIKNYLDDLHIIFSDDKTLIDKELAELEKRKKYLESLKNAKN